MIRIMTVRTMGDNTYKAHDTQGVKRGTHVTLLTEPGFYFAMAEPAKTHQNTFKTPLHNP